MTKQVAAVETNEPEAIDFSAEPDESPPSPRAGPASGPEASERLASERPQTKFLYPGGSSPLAGYTIKRGVGHGGFGEIYYAVSDAGKEVALKLIRRNLDVELRGIRHCLNLKHPNLLSLFDIRQDEQGDTWVVMEFVSGECLEDVILSSPDGMPLPQVLGWFHGIAAGVALLHDRGVVHRDLKPANIFSDEGVVKVGDYGLSKFISCSRRSGQTESVGTVHYMAPEVANGRYGKEIDIYALGIVLYEMLTGHVPFEGESVGEVLMKHLTAQPDVSVLAEPYRTIVARALEKDPAKRFNSVSQMTASLPQPAQAPPGTGRLPSNSQTSGGTGAAGPAGKSGPPPILGTKQPPAAHPPVLRAFGDTCTKLHSTWKEADLHPALKVVLPILGGILIVIGACVLAVMAKPLLALALLGMLIYGGYQLIRLSAKSKHASHHTKPHPPARPTPAAQPPADTVGPEQAAVAAREAAFARTRPGRRRRPRSHEKPLVKMVVKTPRERTIDLLGSMLLGVVVTAAMCTAMVLINTFRGVHGVGSPTAGQCGWLVLVGVLGTWVVMIASKFWEGTQGETALRRFVMMILGLGVGAAAYGIGSLLLVGFPPDASVTRLTTEFMGTHRGTPAGFYAENGRPLLMAFMASFGTLFLLLRWWHQADPTRVARLSLWSLFISVMVAWVVAAVWQFPQPWLPMIAATISVSVQMASPWLHPNKRYRRQNA